MDMSTTNQDVSGGSVFRVDKFVVPANARDEILAKVKMTHELLRLQQGFVQDFLLEQFSGPGEFNLVTIVEWESQAAVDNVVPIVRAAHDAWPSTRRRRSPGSECELISPIISAWPDSSQASPRPAPALRCRAPGRCGRRLSYARSRATRRR